MAAILKLLLEGDLNVEEFEKYLKTGKILKPVGEIDLTDSVTEFVPYFLNFIREESSHHFTSDLPVISPKKIKKKKKQSQPRTPNSNEKSGRSSARGSLFSTPATPSSAKVGSVNESPVAIGQQQHNISPISPPVKQQSHCSPDSSNPKNIVTSTPLKFNMDEDFPPVSTQKESKRKSSTPTRRIAPTPARASYPRRGSSTVFNSTFEESDTSFSSDPSLLSEKSKQQQKLGNMKISFGSASPKSTRRSSGKLTLEDFMQKGSRTRRSRRQESLNTSASELEKSNSFEFSQNSCSGREKDGGTPENNRMMYLPSVTPLKDQVTQQHILQSLAHAHSFCILENLVPNIVVELCFILQLLTIQGNEKNENGFTSRFLTTVHNCVYYAILALENLTRMLKLLDKGTLRLLLDNPRLSEFSSTLKEELNKVYPTISSNKVPSSLVKSPLNSVPFQATVDNRNNFSTDQAFHCFKRQRDTFYEIVREWEDFNGKPGWSLEDKLGSKIRFIVHQKPGLVNHSHFARLFQSQLIQMCCYENSLPTFNEGESPEFVGNLLKSNPEKFFRLQHRLVAPLSTTTGPCPPPGFTETEEFFREFIISAMCPSFNRYLMDSFIAKIIEFNNLEVTESSLLEHPDKDEESLKFQVKFATCVITLRTLAKFLGFLVFFPYHSSTELPLAVKESLVTARNQVAEPLDIMSYLEKAEKDQRLVLTLPWVIEYLSMIDSVGPYLVYYKKVFEFLHHIYKETLLQKSSFDMNRNAFMLSVGVGWLFEVPTIPETVFSKSSGKTLTESEKGNSCLTLDNLDVVDQQLLYTCCPYLGELRSILAEAVIGRTARRGSVKKIKPICADKAEVSSSPCRLLQRQLEDNFFRNQPEFLKKIVDFVTSRIYHNLVVLVKNSIIPSEIKDVKAKLNIESTFNQGDHMGLSKEDFKEQNRGLILRITTKITDETLQRITSEVDRECKERSLNSVKSLSPFDMDEMVIKTAAGIVHRSTMDKVLEWSHQNLTGVVEKEIERNIDRIITRLYNNPLNAYQVQAQDPENAFNWFYQQLVDKAKERSNQPVINSEPGYHEEHEKVKGCDEQSVSNSKLGHFEGSCQHKKVKESDCEPTTKSTETMHSQQNCQHVRDSENETACDVERNDSNNECQNFHSNKEPENAVLPAGLTAGTIT